MMHMVHVAVFIGTVANGSDKDVELYWKHPDYAPYSQVIQAGETKQINGAVELGNVECTVFFAEDSEDQLIFALDIATSRVFSELVVECGGNESILRTNLSHRKHYAFILGIDNNYKPYIMEYTI